MLELAAGTDPLLLRALGYEAARDAVFDARGRTVRCTPMRRTLATDLVLADGRRCRVFRKLRSRRPADAQREWHWLGALGDIGLAVPARVALACAGRDSALLTREVAGRSLDLWLREVEPAVAQRYAVDIVLPHVLRLHRAGLVFRDLYWNHLFSSGLDTAAITFLDVERVLRPWRWRWRRWVVKDLAGLVSSWPGPMEEWATVLCRAYARASGGDGARLGHAVLAKARRIRRHRPRYGE